MMTQSVRCILLSTQCAAVITTSGAMSEPPHQPWKLTIHLRRAPVSTERPHPWLRSAPVSTERPHPWLRRAPVSTERPCPRRRRARLHGMFMSQPRRRRDPSAASPRSEIRVLPLRRVVAVVDLVDELASLLERVALLLEVAAPLLEGVASLLERVAPLLAASRRRGPGGRDGARDRREDEFEMHCRQRRAASGRARQRVRASEGGAW